MPSKDASEPFERSVEGPPGEGLHRPPAVSSARRTFAFAGGLRVSSLFEPGRGGEPNEAEGGSRNPTIQWCLPGTYKRVSKRLDP